MDKLLATGKMMHVCWLLLLQAAVVDACPNTAGVVVGSIFGTLAVVALVLGIVGFLWHQRKKKTGEKKKAALSDEKGYTNKTFSGDVEMQAGTRQNGSASRDQIRDVPAAYVECKEYDSPNKDKLIEASRQKEAPVSAPKAKRNLQDELDGQKKKRPNFDLQICKTGSHGSLDTAVTPNDPEVVSVFLQSSDIIGLGFNISGSLSEGIFVSQVHNRGPASESGQIKVGDRILSITISMENMVYEDALTILSYASPYPVNLKLQRAMPLLGDSSDDEAKLSHPVYRSQSLDDLSKIQKDKWSGPRKTWSEMRRNHPAKDNVDGSLRKWSGTNDIVHEEMILTNKAEKGLEQDTVSCDEPDITTEVTIHSMPAEVIEVNIPEVSSLPDTASAVDQGDHSIKRKSDEVSINIDDSGVVMEPPPSKKARDSLSEDEAMLNGDRQVVTLSERDDLVDIDLGIDQHDNNFEESQESTTLVIESETGIFVSKSGKKDRSDSVSSKSSVSSLSSDSINEEKDTKDIVEGEGPEKLTVADINENEIQISHEYLEEQLKNTQESTDNNVSTVVHVSDSFVSQGNSSPVSEFEVIEGPLEETGTKAAPEKQDKAHEDSVRAVLKDYFGDQPNLLEQFGFDSQKGGAATVTKTVEVTTVTKDGENSKTTKTEAMETATMAEVQEETEDEKAARSRSYQYNKGNKGGMAYYLRIDEGFGGDDDLFGHAFSQNKEQPNLIPVGSSEVITTSKTTSVTTSGFGSADNKQPLANGPESVPSVAEQLPTAAGEA